MLDLLPVQRFRVADTSMQPALRPGDRLLVARFVRARVGDIVVCRDPDATSTFLAKRVIRITPNGEILVSGDNANVSRDSRHFGLIPPSLLIGKVIYRYLPAARRGRL